MEVVRLSIPGYYCVHCGAKIGQKLECPGCGWLDPQTEKEPTDRSNDNEGG